MPIFYKTPFVMYLEKLEIQGFKSFANKNSLVFPGIISGNRRGLTAIVGPNGSGKSNVADSVRWALGEQSMKTLRGKKSEDIIFSGSDKKGKLGMAEVSLYFNNEDHQAPLDLNHFVLTRRLYRDGESEYLLNNSKVRLLDIQILLAKANVGQKTYSVIGQGTVEGFLNTSLSERKEFFDEATGVKQFQIKRDDSLNKLRLSLEHLGQAEMLLAEIEPRLSTLTRQVNKLKKRGEIESELRGFQLDYFRTVWHEINDRFKQANETLLASEKTKQLKEKKIADLTKELASLQKQAGVSEEFNRLQEELAGLQSQKEKLQTELVKITARLELKLETEQSYLDKTTALELQKRLKKSLDLLIKAEQLDDVALIKQALTEIKKELSDLHDLAWPKNNKTNQPVAGSAEQVKLEQEANKINDEINKLRTRLSRFTDEQEKERQKLFDLQNNLQILQQEVNQLNNQLNESRVEAARQETKLEDLEVSIRQDLGGLKEVRDERINKIIDRVLVQDKIIQLKRQLELIGGIDPEIENEYVTTKERHDFLLNQVTDLLDTSQSLEKVIEELDATIKERFDKEFKIISQKFEEYFKILFNGGSAKIIKVMADDPTLNVDSAAEEVNQEIDEVNNLSASAVKLKRIKYLQKYNATGLAGIEIQATPPGKKIKSIAMLSGGERALTAIALICAIISANPSPFVVLDEVDAALDEANSERLAKILDDLSHKTQFIVITHNRASMTRAVVLYGITMQDDGVSKLLSIKLEEAKFNR